MSKPRGGLGRGLAALIPTGPDTTTVSDVLMNGGQPRREPAALTLIGGGALPAPTDGDSGESTHSGPSQEVEASSNGVGPRYRDIPIDAIRRNPRNPRSVFDEDALLELTHSIREFGMLQPVVVRDAADGGYELVMGERRWRAAQRAGLATIPAIIRRTEDADLLRDALLENIHRANLNPLEEAAAYQQLLEEFDVTQDELASRIGRSRPVISNTIRLLKLPVPVQRRVAAGVLSAGHARALLGARDPLALARKIIAEGLSVRQAEALAARSAGAPARRKKPIEKDADTRALERDLAKLLGLSVEIVHGSAGGALTIRYRSLEQLERGRRRG